MTEKLEDPTAIKASAAKHVGDCLLCGAVGVPLLDSHIMPKWTYRRARGSAGPGLSSDPIVIQEGVALQTSAQLKEHMLCVDCEQRFGRDEDYVKRLAYQEDGTLGVMSKVDPATAIRPQNNPIGIHARAFPIPWIDHVAVARFAASMFWRAHVAKRSKVDSLFLWNPQAEALRHFLLSQKNLPERMCLFLWAIAEGDAFDSPYSGTFATPTTTQKGQNSWHQFIVAGLMFTLSTGTCSPSSLCLVCGRPHLLVQDWRYIRHLQTLKDAAISAEPKGRGAKAARSATPLTPPKLK